MSERSRPARTVRARGAASSADSLEPVNILLVDDRPENLLALAAILDAPGRTLVTVGSGREALRALLKRDFAVVLLDVNMPDMDGFETAALIRQRPASSHTPIIFMTAHGDESQVVKAYSLGAVDYILAPINPDVLTAKIAVFVDLFRKTEENRRQAEQLRKAEEQLRRRAEQQLEEAHARLQQIIDNVADYAIFSLDADARIATWNAGAERLFQYHEEEVVGRDVTMLLPREAQHGNVVARQCANAITGGRGEVETWFRRKDGSQFYGAGLVNAMRDARGDLVGFSKVTRDITDRKRADEALRRQAEELAEANRVKDEFLAVLSHELRTPLNAILGWSRMLLDGRVDADTARRGLESISRNAVAQLGLVNDILDVSRFVTGKFRMELAPLDVRTVMEAALETGRSAAAPKGITLEMTVPPAPVTVNGDASRLQQVIWNLVSNAVKFTPDGGQVRVEIAHDDHTATIHVRDNGIGISRDFLPYVFDRFRQADSSASRSAGGLGLGLAIVKHIVEMHGGMVTVDSEGQGRGSTFTVCLPLVRQAAAADGRADGASAHMARMAGANGDERAPVVTAVEEPDLVATDKEAPTSPAQPGGDGVPASSITVPSPNAPHETAHRLVGIHCLVVDDDADTRFLLRRALETYGARVTVTASAREAVEHVGEADILLADLAMPGEDGYSMIRRIRGRGSPGGSTIPAIALTAHASEVDRRQALAAGFQEHLVKPIDRERVVDAILHLLKVSGTPAAR